MASHGTQDEVFLFLLTTQLCTHALSQYLCKTLHHCCNLSKLFKIMLKLQYVKQTVSKYLQSKIIIIICDVARTFLGRRLAHPEGQNEEENEESLRKSKKNCSKFEEKMRKVELLPIRDCEAGYGPANNVKLLNATMGKT